MLIYPFSAPIILNSAIFVEYGGKTGSFTQAQLNSSFLLAEMQASKYIGTLLLPSIVTGTYPYMGRNRIATDYGYVHQLYSVNVLSKSGICGNCDLTSREGCGYIYEDTFGYIDFKVLSSICSGCAGSPYPYQIQFVYQAGLPTGVANFPGILEALTIASQIDLNEKEPGMVGMNEGVGDVGIQSFRVMDYAETRRMSSLKRTVFGSSAKANRAANLIDGSVRKARRVLML
jgi:hypothetical protein